MIPFDPNRVRLNVRQATTEDLLDRVTAYRPGMEPEALAIIEEELGARGVTPADIDDHSRQRDRHAFLLPDGTARPCSTCRRPAVGHRWGWQRLWKVLPVFPRYVFYCEEHRPD